MAEGVIRFTSMANYDRWTSLSQEDYIEAKQRCHQQIVETAIKFVPDFRSNVVYMDMFTPRTIEKFTGHFDGAVYGAARKRRDGRTRLNNLFLCGTDQGFLGVIGAMLSGITIANLHVLSVE